MVDRDDRAYATEPLSRRRFLGLAASAVAVSVLPTGQRLGVLAGGPASAGTSILPPVRVPGSLPFPGRPAGHPQPDLAPDLAPIEHIVVVMLENHSFDNQLGMLPHRVAGLRNRVDGWPHLDTAGVPTAMQTGPDGISHRAFRLAGPCQRFASADTPTQTWDASHQAFNGGTMDGFLARSGPAAMGYWDDGVLPFLYSLAANFPVCDRYFASTLCQTFPNRLFAIAATAAGQVRTDAALLPVRPPNGHIFQVLDHHHIGWTDYFTDYPTSGLVGVVPGAATTQRSLVGPSGNTTATLAAFAAACTAGTLAPVVMVEPDYANSSEEPPQNILAGEAFVAGVVSALYAAPATWASTLLLVCHDEHGGFYDHVAPPAALAPGDGAHPDLPQTAWYGDDYTRYGFRVPAVIVSPWARAGHTSHLVYDHASILSTIERKWNLPALTYRDANANHFGNALVDHGRPPFEIPPVLAATTTPGPLAGPGIQPGSAGAVARSLGSCG